MRVWFAILIGAVFLIPNVCLASPVNKKVQQLFDNRELIGDGDFDTVKYPTYEVNDKKVLRKHNIDENYFKDWDKIDKIRRGRQVRHTELLDTVKNEGAVILDVRSKEDFDCGHIKGAKNLSLADITEKTLPMIVPSKQTKVIIYCEKTLRQQTRMIAATQIAFPVIYKLGYQNLYEIEPVQTSSENDVKNFEKTLSFEKSEKCSINN